MDQPTPRTLVVLAVGAEEMEAVIVVDVLRRAEIEVVVAGLDGRDPVTCSRGVTLLPDTDFASAARESFDCIVLPGGAEGSDRLAQSTELGHRLRGQVAAGGWIAAICAAPAALVAHSIGRGATLTSHPSVRDVVATHARYSEDSVAVDGKLITSRGPGTAFEFALAIVERLRGADSAAVVRAPMMLDRT